MKANLSLADYAVLRKRQDESLGWITFLVVAILFGSGILLSCFLPFETFDTRMFLIEENSLSTYLPLESKLFPLEEKIEIDGKLYSVSQKREDQVVFENGIYLKKVQIDLNSYDTSSKVAVKGKIRTGRSTFFQYIWNLITGGDE